MVRSHDRAQLRHEQYSHHHPCAVGCTNVAARSPVLLRPRLPARCCRPSTARWRRSFRSKGASWSGCSAPKFRRDLRTVVNDTPWNEPWTDTLEALSTLDDAAIIVIERLIVASDIEVPTELLDTDVLGLLTKSMYDPLIAPTRLSRSNYLRGRLGARSLTREQLELAHTLSLEWTGTLDSLVETVRGLSPH